MEKLQITLKGKDVIIDYNGLNTKDIFLCFCEEIEGNPDPNVGLIFYAIALAYASGGPLERIGELQSVILKRINNERKKINE